MSDCAVESMEVCLSTGHYCHYLRRERETLQQQLLKLATLVVPLHVSQHTSTLSQPCSLRQHLVTGSLLA